MADDLVLQILRGLQADMAEMRRDVAALKQDVAIVKQDVAALKVNNNILIQDGRMIRAALSDLGKTRVSAGEIEAMHADINGLMERVAALESRVD
jgi:polyhydroxyalkanoate synthesis regulator phasin